MQGVLWWSMAHDLDLPRFILFPLSLFFFLSLTYIYCTAYLLSLGNWSIPYCAAYKISKRGIWESNTVKTRIIEPFAMSLKLPPLVRSGVFVLLFMTLRRTKQLYLCCVFRPFSQVGNSQLHSTRFYYSSFYGK